MQFEVKIYEHYIPFFVRKIIICHFLIFITTKNIYISKTIILVFGGYINNDKLEEGYDIN